MTASSYPGGATSGTSPPPCSISAAAAAAATAEEERPVLVLLEGGALVVVVAEDMLPAVLQLYVPRLVTRRPGLCVRIRRSTAPRSAGLGPLCLERGEEPYRERPAEKDGEEEDAEVSAVPP